MKKLNYIGFITIAIWLIIFTNTLEVKAADNDKLTGGAGSAMSGSGMTEIAKKGSATCSWNITYYRLGKQYTATVSRKSSDLLQNGSWTCKGEDSFCNSIKSKNSFMGNVSIPSPTSLKEGKIWECPTLSYYVEYLGGPDIEWHAEVFSSVSNNLLSGLSGDQFSKSLGKDIPGIVSDVVQGSDLSDIFGKPEEEEENEENIQHCYYQRSTDEGFELRIDKDTKKAKTYFNGAYMNTIEVSSLDCSKIKEQLRYCYYEFGDGSIPNHRLTLSRNCVEFATDSRPLEFWKLYKLDFMSEGNTSVSNPMNDPDKKDKFENANLEWGELVTGCKVVHDIKDHVQTLFDWVKILAPILLIVFGIIDFGKATITNDNDALKKATTSFIKRAIAAVAIFFLPLIINLLLNLPGVESELDDALCGISKVVIK